MKSLFPVFLITICLQLVVVSKISANVDPHVRDLKILVKWFEGEFDNDSQIWLEGRRDWQGNSEEKHQRMHAIHTKIENEKIGKHVFYVEEYVDDDVTNITRQRVVSFKTDPEAQGIRMKIYFLKNQKQYVHAHQNMDLLNQIDENQLTTLDGCDVIFKRVGEQYHGSMADKACQFGEGALKRYSVHDMIISENQYWRVDRTFLVKNNQFHKGHPNDEPHKMRKASKYVCDVSFHEKAYYLPSDKDKHYKEVIIHNQGGIQWLDNPIKGKKYGVQLREKEYPFYEEGSDFFMLRFIEEGKKASEVIVTAEPGVKKISFSIGWASAACKMIVEEE